MKAQRGKHLQDYKAVSQMHSSQCPAAWHSQTPFEGSSAPHSSHVEKQCQHHNQCLLWRSCIQGIYLHSAWVQSAPKQSAGGLKAKRECHISCRKQGCFHPADSRANGILSSLWGGLATESHSPGQQSCCPSADQQEDALPLYLNLAHSCHVKTQAWPPIGMLCPLWHPAVL